jgi:hypothetical protein
MDESSVFDIKSVRFTFEVDEYTDPEDLLWLPDAATLVLQIQNGSGEEDEYPYGYTCLEHAFVLLNRLEMRESGWVLWGTGPRTIRFHDDGVTLLGDPDIIGSISEFQMTTEDLIKQMFEYLRHHDLNTTEVTTNIANGHFAPWEINPIGVHHRLQD